MNRYMSDQRIVVNLLAGILENAYPAVNKHALNIIAKQAIASSDIAARLYYMHTSTGAMLGESIVNVLVSDALHLNIEWEEIEL